jgi:nicotinate-nucleotide adenylyltransferase
MGSDKTIRLGVFGGTFDPPHLGHLILASEAGDQLSLDRVLWVLTPDPPHKQGQLISSLEQRLPLVEAAIQDNPIFALSKVDIERQAPHYAVDTLLQLRKVYPTAQLVYVMGGDSLHDLPTWHAPQEFLAAADELGVMRRPGDEIYLEDLERALPGLHSKLRFVDTPLLQISASDIRRRVANGRPFRYFLTPAVYTLVLQEKLYQQE